MPCLVLVDKRIGHPNLGVEIYISKHLEELVSEPHREYISRIIIDFSSRSDSDLDQILVDAKNLSVGPLRIGFRGSCDEKDLHRLLSEIFDRSGYFPIN